MERVEPRSEPRSERRAALRTAVVWDAVQRALAGSQAGQAARIVDVGGGTGGFAVRLAEQGHRVTVVDPSPDALAALGRRADERGVADRVTGVQGDVSDLRSLVGSGADGADLVLCHGVLGVVVDPAAAIGSLAAVLRPGGTLSLLVSQRHAAVLHRAMAGNLAEARDLLTDPRGGTAGGEHRFTAPELADLLAAAGFTSTHTQAVRVFTDLVPAATLDGEPGAIDALLELERTVADRPEYLALATQLHLLAST